MKEHEDDVLRSVKEASAAVDSATADEIVTERAKIEGVLSERDEGEDVMVDVVSADVVVDDHGGAGVNLDGKKDSDGIEEGLEGETVPRDRDVEDDVKIEVVVCEEGVTRSVEVSKEVLEGNVMSGSDSDAQKSGNGAGVGYSKTDFEPLSVEPEVGDGEIAVRDDKEVTEMGSTEEIVGRATESAQEVAGGDDVMEEKAGQEAEILNKIVDLGSLDVVEKGLVGKDEAEDDVDNQSLSTVVINAGTDEGAVDVSIKNMDQQAELDQTSKEECLHPTNEDSTNDTQRSGNGTRVEDSEMKVESLSGEPELVGGEIAVRGEEPERGLIEETVERPMESVQEVGDVDHVRNENTGKEDEVLDSAKIPESEIKANLGSEEIQEEGLAIKGEAQDIASEDPNFVCPNNRTLPTGVANAGTGEGAHVNTESLAQQAEVDKKSKEVSSHSTTVGITNDAPTSEKETVVGDSKMADEPSSRGLESVQEVVDGDDKVLDSSKIPESLTTANLGSEEVDVVVVEEGLSGKDEAQDGVSEDPSLVCLDNDAAHVNPENLNHQDEVDEKSKEESSHSTIEGITNDDQKSGKGTGVDSKMANEPLSRGLTEEIVERPVESVQEPADADRVMDEKTRKEDEVLDSSKIPESLSTIVDLGSEEVDVVVVEEGSARKDEAQDGVSVDPSLVHPEDRYLSHIDVPNSTVEVPSTGEMNSFQVSADYSEHGVVPAESEFSFEEAQVERGEDAGMDIDEVLGWKDEIPAIDTLSGNVDCPEKDQNFKINANLETVIEQGLPESSEPALIEHQDEDSKFRQPIVYERRVHVEVPILDENLKVEKVNEDVEVHTDFCRDQETEALDHISEPELSMGIDEIVENETLVPLQQSCYFPSPQNEGEFSSSDLVWGKVRSHPWWPGQIFDPSDASEKAMKYHKKDCFLVAYFGDRTFAWNDSTVLKPFRASFSQIEKHGNSEAFKNAVNSALEEVSRRVEFGLSCSCVSHDVYKNIEYQVVDNAGIKQESSRRHGLDESAGVNSFEPDKLVDYVRLLAKFPYGEGSKMDLAMAKAQLSSYGRFKGYRNLPKFLICGDLSEEASINKNDEPISDKINANKKEGNLSELTLDGEDGAEELDGSGFKKRKALDSISDGPEKRPSLHTEKAPIALSPTPKPSFKVGECIQRVASQLTGPPLVPDQLVEVGAGLAENPQTGNTANEAGAGLAEMVSQLRLAAQDPMKGHSFLNTIIPFFHSHRASVFVKSLRQNLYTGKLTDGRKRKPSNENDPEEFEFDDINDSYWTDRIIQNHPEEQPLQPLQPLQDNNQNGGQEYQIVSYEPEPVKPAQPARRSNKKRFFSSNHEIEAKEQSELIERRRQNLATEVLLKFTEGIYFPSELHLNKMFRRFGPLMESETEVDRQRGRARVVFKKCSDAEVAHSSAGKFNIFGSISVNYELNYNPLVSYKPLPLPVVQDPAGAC